MNRTITVRLVASTAQFQAAMGAAAAQTKAVSRDMHTMAVNGDQSMRMLGKGMLVAGGLIAGGLAISVAKAMEFETQMRNVNSIAKMSEDQFAATSGQVLAMSRKVPQSAATLAQGLYDIASSGFQGADAMKILESSAIGATAGMTTTDVAAKAITATLNAYGRNASEAGDISDVLFKTVEVGVITFEELASGMGDWIGMAAAAKVPVDEAASAIAAMTLSGIGAAEAGTSLNRTLQALISPGEELQATLKELGYESGAQALETDGLRGVMEKLRTATGGNIEQIQALFPEVRALRGVLALTANEGRNFGNTFDAVTDKQKRAGAAQAAYAEQSKALSVQWDLAKSSATAFAIEVGNRMLPILAEVAKTVAGVFDGFSSLPGPVITAGTALAGIAAVALTLGGGLILLAPRIHQTNLALQTMGTSGQMAARGLSGIMGLAGKAGLIGMVAVALDQVASAINKAVHTQVGVQELVKDLEHFAETGKVTGDLLAGFGADLAALESIQSGRGLFDGLITSAKTLLPFLAGIDTGTENLEKNFAELDSALALMAEQGNLDQARVMFRRLAEDAARLGIPIEELEARYFPRYTQEAGRAAAASDELSAAAEAERHKIDELGAVIGDTTTKTEDLSEVQKMLKEQYETVGKAIGSFSAPMNAYDAALESNKVKAQDWADAQNASMEKTKVTWKDYMVTAEDGSRVSAEFFGDAKKAEAQAWADAQNASLKDAQVGVEDFAGGVIPSLAQINDELVKNLEAFTNWKSNLVEITKRGRGDLALELAKLGPEQAPVVQAFVNDTSRLFNEAADNWVEAARRGNSGVEKEIVNGAVVQAAAMRQGAGATVESLAQELDIAPEIVRRVAEEMNLKLGNAQPRWQTLWSGWGSTARRSAEDVRRDVPPLAGAAADESEREVARRGSAWGSSWWARYWGAKAPTDAMRRDVPPVVGATGGAMSDVLAGGLPRFQQTVGGYAGSLEGGVRTVAIAAAGDAVRRAVAGLRLFADGGFYANGGLKESHQAQIARAGDWRIWAEDETGGEAYIPLAQSKRGRSVPIWLETGRRLGLDEDSLDYLRGAMQFHEGGLVDFPRRPDLPGHGPPIRPRGEATMDNMLAFAKQVAAEHMKLPHHQAPAMDMSIGGGAGAGMGYQWQMAVLRQRFPGLQLISGYRPGAITATGNPSWHGKGRAVDIPPRMDVNKWIAANYGAGTKELIFSLPGATQIRHGRPHVYSGITKAMHYDHNHWAYKFGGMLDGFTEQFNGVRSFDSGGYLPPGYTLAHNGTGRSEVIPTPMGPGASQPASRPSVTITTTNEWRVEGELTPSTVRKLEGLMDQNNRELATMLEAQGVRG